MSYNRKMNVSKELKSQAALDRKWLSVEVKGMATLAVGDMREAFDRNQMRELVDQMYRVVGADTYESVCSHAVTDVVGILKSVVLKVCHSSEIASIGPKNKYILAIVKEVRSLWPRDRIFKFVVDAADLLCSDASAEYIDDHRDAISRTFKRAYVRAATSATKDAFPLEATHRVSYRVATRATRRSVNTMLTAATNKVHGLFRDKAIVLANDIVKSGLETFAKTIVRCSMAFHGRDGVSPYIGQEHGDVESNRALKYIRSVVENVFAVEQQSMMYATQDRARKLQYAQPVVVPEQQSMWNAIQEQERKLRAEQSVIISDESVADAEHALEILELAIQNFYLAGQSVNLTIQNLNLAQHDVDLAVQCIDISIRSAEHMIECALSAQYR